MDDPTPKKRGRPKGGKAGGRGNRKNRRLSSIKKGNECNKMIAEVVAEPTENYDELAYPTNSIMSIP